MDSIHVLITTYKVHPYYSATISVVKCIATRCGSRISFVVSLLLTFWGSVGHGWRKHSVALLTVHFYFYFCCFVKNLMHKLWTGALQAMCHRKCYVQVDRGFVGVVVDHTKREMSVQAHGVSVFANQKKSTKMCDHFHEMLFLCNKCFSDINYIFTLLWVESKQVIPLLAFWVSLVLLLVL